MWENNNEEYKKQRKIVFEKLDMFAKSQLDSCPKQIHVLNRVTGNITTYQAQYFNYAWDGTLKIMKYLHANPTPHIIKKLKKLADSNIKWDVNRIEFHANLNTKNGYRFIKVTIGELKQKKRYFTDLKEAEAEREIVMERIIESQNKLGKKMNK